VRAGRGRKTVDDQSLYDEAVLCVTHAQRVSALLLQRSLEIDYIKASTIIEKMEKAGIVSETDFHGRRSVLIKTESSQKQPKDISICILNNNDNENTDYLRIALIFILSSFVLSLVFFSI
jgi:hypothetical protein